MAGRRLIDAAKLFDASRSIAKQHINLRSQQLDVYSKTSTLAKTVKNQTDRVTLTAKAAVALAERFNEAPSYTRSAGKDPTSRSQDEPIPSKEAVNSEDTHGRVKAEPSPDEELGIKREKSRRQPLPDGAIPPPGTILESTKEPLTQEQQNKGQDEDDSIRPVVSGASAIPTPSKASELSPEEARQLQRQAEFQIPPIAAEPQPSAPQPKAEKLSEGHDRDVFYTRSTNAKPEYSSLPRAKIPKNTEDKQGRDEHVENGQINPDVFYSTPEAGQGSYQKEQIPHQAAALEQEQVPKCINTDVFRTARVARMLGGNPYRDKTRLDLKGASRTPIDHTELATHKNQDTFNVRQTAATTPTKPEQIAWEGHQETPSAENEIRDFASNLAKDVEATSKPLSETPPGLDPSPQKTPYELRESRVPASRFGRLWQYGGLATSIAFGAVGESLRRVTGSAASTGGSLMLSPGNMEILVAKLSRMRGAALKLGQMISFQDLKMLPPPIHEVLQRVQDSADYMPASQRNKVLSANLGADWRDLFTLFEEVPIAAASIGQVHKAVLRSNSQPVAVKVQYPGVANSIDSDLNNLSILLTASRLLPKGLYLDKTIANARTELGWECDYLREAECQERFRALLADDTAVFTVPIIFPEASGKEVLTAELMGGIGVTKLPSLDQAQRDWIGMQILRLCLREIAEFKFMQTDPNWTNFLYNEKQHKIELLDFGASRDYPDEFIDPYMRVLVAAAKNDRRAIGDLSIQLGYLTGAESKSMLEAHIQSVLTLAEPFKESGPLVYDFRDQTITDRVRGLIPVMVKERLAPPPEETYSLHRKLSGAFLMCARLGSRVPCRELFRSTVERYRRKGKIDGGNAWEG